MRGQSPPTKSVRPFLALVRSLGLGLEHFGCKLMFPKRGRVR